MPKRKAPDETTNAPEGTFKVACARPIVELDKATIDKLGGLRFLVVRLCKCQGCFPVMRNKDQYYAFDTFAQGIKEMLKISNFLFDNPRYVADNEPCNIYLVDTKLPTDAPNTVGSVLVSPRFCQSSAESV